jgi:hypothetical protein
MIGDTPEKLICFAGLECVLKHIGQFAAGEGLG